MKSTVLFEMNFFLLFFFKDVLSLTVWWNVPSQPCKNTSHSRRIVHNKFQTYRGEEADRIVYLDERVFGLWPQLENLTNGGIPQKGNLEAHLKKVRNDLDIHVPNHDYAWLLVIALEHWIPSFDLNLDSYQKESIRLIQQKYPLSPEEEILIKAKEDFERAAGQFISSTIETIRKLRPKALIGLHGYPFFARQHSSYPLKTIQEANDQLVWLYNLVDYLLPSLYLYKEQQKMNEYIQIRNILQETNRVQKKLKEFKPALAYTRFERDPTDMNDPGFYNEIDLCNTVTTGRNMGINGVVFWSSEKNMEKRCPAFAHYVNEKLVPFLNKEIAFSDKCTKDICGGHGLCYADGVYDIDYCKEFTDSEMKCYCAVGRKGKDCSEKV